MFGKNDVSKALRIEAELGYGGSGTVYKAWHKRLQKYVVVKEYEKTSWSDIETRRNEVEALKNIKCVFLPVVLDFFSKGRRSFTVMEYVEGVSFDKPLERGEVFGQSTALKYYRQLALALIALHDKDVCHRDVKPSNIMLTPDDNICLIDFNAAFVRGRVSGFTSRSPGYASPEQSLIYEILRNAKGARERDCSPIASGHNDCETETAICERGSRTEHAITESAHKYTHTKCTHTKRTHAACTYIRCTNTRYTNPGCENSGYSCADGGGFQLPPAGNASFSDGVDWKLSDIYSLGATMYHIISGVRPPEPAEDTAALSDIGRFNADLAYVIEKSMQSEPLKRFSSAAALYDAIEDIKI